MKLVESNRFVTNNVVFKTHSFGIKSENLSHIVHILRDQLYSDKILAVIRETSTNAFDANVMAGKGDVPIVVTLPSKLDPTFKVRDNGNGMSNDEIVEIFCSYGASTKRSSNAVTGMLGLGAKSPWALGDNFLVTSFNNGIKTCYDMVLDKSNLGNCIELMSEPMSDTDKEGIEITINVKKDDIDQFRSKAINFFQYWTVKPNLLGFTEDTLAEKEKKVLFNGSNWTIYANENRNNGYHYNSKPIQSLALMGNIAYPINWNTVRLPDTNNSTNQAMVSYLKNSNLLIRFNIGDLEFAPSREALQYTDFTNTAIHSAMTLIMSEIEVVILNRFKSCTNLFEAKQLFGELFEYGGELNELYDYFTKKGLVWNNIKIDSSKIIDFNKYELDLGFKQDGHDFGYGNNSGTFPITRFTMSGSILKCRKGNHHSDDYNNIDCTKAVKILLYDYTKHNYARRAVHYLIAKDPTIKTVYVLDFKGKQALQDLCFKNLQLDLVPMIKYTDIMVDVKASIVRTTPTGTTITAATRAESVRNTKFVTVENNTTDYSYRSSDNIWEKDEIDFATDTGYYVKLQDNNLQWDSTIGGNSLNIYNVCNVINMLNGLGQTNITEIYGFGPKILDSKVFDATKWTRVETVISEKLAKMSNDIGFKWYAAFKKISNKFNHGEIPSWSFIGQLAKLSTDAINPIVKLDELVKKYKADKSSHYDNLLNRVGDKAVCVAEIAEIEVLIRSIIKKYPLLPLTKAYSSDHTELTTLDTISTYINQIDVIKIKQDI